MTDAPVTHIFWGKNGRWSLHAEDRHGTIAHAIEHMERVLTEQITYLTPIEQVPDGMLFVRVGMGLPAQAVECKLLRSGIKLLPYEPDEKLEAADTAVRSAHDAEA